jgi:hypothetical protein
MLMFSCLYQGCSFVQHFLTAVLSVDREDPPTQGALESKRDTGTWNGTRCDGPPLVDDQLTLTYAILLGKSRQIRQVSKITGS